MRNFFMGLVLVCTFVVFGTWIFAAMPGPDANALWAYIAKDFPYTQWSEWPDHQGMQPGRAPHGSFNRVYVNDQLKSSTQAPVQYGSIEVKENYADNKELKSITVMYKIEGYNPQDGDWFWAVYSPDGKTLEAGKIDSCIGCHGTRAKNDFIIVHDLH